MAMLPCTAATLISSNPKLQFSSSITHKNVGRRASFPSIRAETNTSSSRINPSIRKEEAKVVDNVAVAELSKPLTAYCRCWRSGTFPLCDGTHVKHNKETGDNVGPLLLKKEKQ